MWLILVFAITLRNWTMRVTICEGGFFADRFRIRRSFPWKSIREVREEITREYKSSGGLQSPETKSFT